MTMLIAGLLKIVVLLVGVSAWAVFGLLLAVGVMTRYTAAYCFAIFASAMHRLPIPTEVRRNLDYACKFYPLGFRSAFDAIYGMSTIEPQVPPFSWSRIIGETFSALILWMVPALVYFGLKELTRLTHSEQSERQLRPVVVTPGDTGDYNVQVGGISYTLSTQQTNRVRTVAYLPKTGEVLVGGGDWFFSHDLDSLDAKRGVLVLNNRIFGKASKGDKVVVELPDSVSVNGEPREPIALIK